MLMVDKYWPCDITEVEQKVSLANEPIREEVIELRPVVVCAVGWAAQSGPGLAGADGDQGCVCAERCAAGSCSGAVCGHQNQIRALAATLELDLE